MSVFPLASRYFIANNITENGLCDPFDKDHHYALLQLSTRKYCLVNVLSELIGLETIILNDLKINLKLQSLKLFK
jgi:hypothetical protein